MVLFLTGSPTRYGDNFFTSDNGFLDELLSCLPAHPRTLLVSAAPDDLKFTESVLDGMSRCIRNSGIECECITMLDRRNAGNAAELVKSSDWVILCGGHVPTQNRFIRELGLSALMKDYDGVVMGCSAGSMNCADTVYSHPELEGESVDPHYARWLKGLGLTDIQLVPHYDQVRYAILDGRRLFEDIIFPDSWQHRFFTFPDGGYVICRDGRSEIRGTAWEISQGGMKQISTENESYSTMNFIFVSPNFPENYRNFCIGLKKNGVNVLGIADTPYDNLPSELKNALTEYYKVGNLEDYNEVYRAVAYFAFKYGKIDWIESNNEYWLEKDARLRTDFNVATGLRNDHISAVKNKSDMKTYYALGGIPTARQIKASEGLKNVLAFTEKTGYPIISKPDNGVGASSTYKLKSEAELRAWFEDHSADYQLYVIEEFITGLLVSYDGIFNSRTEPLFESMSVFPTPMIEVVNDDKENCYYVDKTVPAALSKAGRKTVKAFGVNRRFVHLEFFKLDCDRPGLGKKGDFVGLEVNMRPAGGFTPDMMNYAHSTDVYQIWADMVAFDERRKGFGDQYFCAYASRKDHLNYAHTEKEILEKYGKDICSQGRMPDALALDLGNSFYMARFTERKDMHKFFAFVTEKK